MTKVAFFSTKPYDRLSFKDRFSKHQIQASFLDSHLDKTTANIAAGHTVVCAFVNDCIDSEVLKIFKQIGVQMVALRSAGFNHVDLKTAQELGIKIARVPAYSPHAVAEHTLALVLCLNRKIHKAYNRIREGNFALNGLLGFDMHTKTVGILGTGKIGTITAKLFKSFGCRVIAHDLEQSQELIDAGVNYVSLDQIFREASIISLHLPLNRATKHIIDSASIEKMQPGVMIVNTSRGGLINTKAVIAGLKSKKIGNLAIDVYEEEENLFFDDHSGEVIGDDTFSRLLTFPNVLITGHQAFFTETALNNIADTTVQNIVDFSGGKTLKNEVKL